MSRDRVTMTRAEAIRLRHEEEQKRRESLVKKTISRPKPAAAKPKINQRPLRLVPAKPQGGARGKPAPAKAAKPGLHSNRYDIAMSAPYGRVGAGKQAPSLAMPKISFGPRWISFLLVALCGVALYFVTSDSYFTVSSANVIGNNRVSADEISSALGVMGLPAAMLNPAQVEYNLLAAFPDIATAQVEINLPAEIVVTVSERQPIAAWQQDGQTVWVDAQGYAFPPRGFVEGLVTINALSAPPVPANVDLTQVIGARPFLSEEMAAALMILSPHVPQGSSLVYDPRYGLGWTDPRGWQAYFGHTHGDVNTKLQVYQSMVDYLIKQGITPQLISVEYPDAPFYRTK
jgi:hypothetical protein